MVNGEGQILEACGSERILGRYTGDVPGPTLIVLAAIHGNEPAGVEAARRVLAAIGPERSRMRGEFVCVTGNLKALQAGVRFIDSDLNRQWTQDRVAVLRARRDGLTAAEFAERREVLDTLEGIVARARDSIYFLDLHTSSADGAPFLTVGDTLRNRSFALKFPLPLILGLEEQVDGALLEYLNNFGIVTIGVEGGRHDAPHSVERHEAVIWLALVAAGVLPGEAVGGLSRYREMLEAASRTVPRIVEVRHRHAITPADAFRMEPGYHNFLPVRAGARLGRDVRGDVVAPESGLVLLPLYQGQGDDGFFICREVHAVWLTVSAVLRRLRLQSIIRFLPGVRRHPRERDVLIVNTRIARWFPLEVFHLFGFRKLRRSGAELVVTRRRYDLASPRRISLP